LLGTETPILWGFAYEDNNKTLNWCTEDMKYYKDRKKVHPVPITVQGRLDKPFILMSWPSENPNLNAVDVLDAYNITTMYCFHFNETSSEGYSYDSQGSPASMQTISNADSSLSDIEQELRFFY
jgi:hypothetical protein